MEESGLMLEDISHIMKVLKSENSKVVVPDEYESDFLKAFLTFKF
jgi:hypothetical protein